MLASETRLVYLGKEERIQDRVLHRWKKLFRAAFGKNWKISPLHYRNKIGLSVSVCVHMHRSYLLISNIKVLVEERITNALW